MIVDNNDVDSLHVDQISSGNSSANDEITNYTNESKDDEASSLSSYAYLNVNDSVANEPVHNKSTHPIIESVDSDALFNHNKLFSTDNTIKKVGVIGLGLMGHGVAQIIASTRKYEVIAIESKQEQLDIGYKRIQDSLAKLLSRDVKNKIVTETQSKELYDEILSKITVSTNINDVSSCDLIIEAIIENIDIKLDFYKKLGQIASSHTIFASNTSSLQITEMAKASGRPNQFVGLHFFNPVQIMKLLEVIKTDYTDPLVYNQVIEFGKSIGKSTVQCSDTPGFIVNRLLVPYITQALALYDRKDASIVDIDTSMQLGAGHPMGPFQLADYIGLDTLYNILIGWKKDHPNESAFFIPACLEEKINANQFGRKTGQGFYIWKGDKIVEPANK
eukprot:gene19535-25433_t